jgi:hypothetical protein
MTGEGTSRGFGIMLPRFQDESGKYSFPRGKSYTSAFYAKVGNAMMAVPIDRRHVDVEDMWLQKMDNHIGCLQRYSLWGE